LKNEINNVYLQYHNNRSKVPRASFGTINK
jgi:hypothetical protein